MKIKKDFFKERAHLLAPKLLGMKITDGKCSGIISEVEAYEGANDPASHAYKITPRSTIMLSTFGHFYVYFIYGNHYCLNITCGEGEPGAVLIRELIPIDGINLMKKRRGTELESNLCSGPGKLCQALGVDKSYNGLTVGKKLWLEKNSKKKIVFDSLPRIGIKKGMDLLWRFRISES
jgi:DNA-3-methyladenine glycosylase